MSNATEMTVLLHDGTISSETMVWPNSDVRVFHQLLPEKILNTKNLFVITSATGLQEVATIVKTADKQHHLRAVFVRPDIDMSFVCSMFEQAQIRSLRNVIVHSSSDVPRRVLEAWQAGVQKQLIANASVDGEHLFVLDCALKSWKVPFDSIPALSLISVEERPKFEIDEDGSYIYWPSYDIHLDMEALRSAVDPKLQKKLAAERAMYDSRFGQAVAEVRKAHKLPQTDIPGI